MSSDFSSKTASFIFCPSGCRLASCRRQPAGAGVSKIKVAHVALQNVPFRLAKRPILQAETACFGTQNGIYCKPVEAQCVIVEVALGQKLGVGAMPCGVAPRLGCVYGCALGGALRKGQGGGWHGRCERNFY